VRDGGVGLDGVGFGGARLVGVVSRRVGGRQGVQERGGELGAGPQRLTGRLGAPVGRAVALGDLLLDGVEDPRAEDVAQQGVALSGRGPQEAGEPSLRQDDRLGELVPSQAHDAGDLGADVVEAGDGLADGARAGGRQPPQPGGGVLTGGTRPALLGASVFGAAQDPVDAGGGGEGQVRLGAGGGVDKGGAQALLGRSVGVGDPPVEGKDDGIDDGGLAGTGGTGEQEAAGIGETVEVDGLGARVGTDTGHGQRVQSHDGLPSFAARAAS
jgi:hypothetical protein